MYNTIAMPDLADLLNQFESIGGPEEYGPEGIAILLAIWRKSSKLGWKKEFQMTNTELSFQTGIKSRDTINTHRNKLVKAKFIRYISPPRGSSKGTYEVNFNIADDEEPVQNVDYFSEKDEKVVRNSDMVEGKVVRITDNFQKVVGEPVQNVDYFSEKDEKVVQFSDAVLKDTIITATNTDHLFNELLQAYCQIHSKLDIQVKAMDIALMQEMIALGVPISLIIKVMKTIYQDRGEKIHSFSYYKNAILDAWETDKAINTPSPKGTFALGPRSKQQKQIDELDRFIEEERNRGDRRSS